MRLLGSPTSARRKRALARCWCPLGTGGGFRPWPPCHHPRAVQFCCPRGTCCAVCRSCEWGRRVESSPKLRLHLFALGSPRVCVRRDSKHAQGTVLKARACWVLQLALAASARWLVAGVLGHRQWVQALATLPPPPRRSAVCPCGTCCSVCRSSEWGPRVESSSYH